MLYLNHFLFVSDCLRRSPSFSEITLLQCALRGYNTVLFRDSAKSPATLALVRLCRDLLLQWRSLERDQCSNVSRDLQTCDQLRSSSRPPQCLCSAATLVRPASCLDPALEHVALCRAVVPDTPPMPMPCCLHSQQPCCHWCQPSPLRHPHLQQPPSPHSQPRDQPLRLTRPSTSWSVSSRKSRGSWCRTQSEWLLSWRFVSARGGPPWSTPGSCCIRGKRLCSSASCRWRSNRRGETWRLPSPTPYASSMMQSWGNSLIWRNKMRMRVYGQWGRQGWIASGSERGQLPGFYVFQWCIHIAARVLSRWFRDLAICSGQGLVCFSDVCIYAIV